MSERTRTVTEADVKEIEIEEFKCKNCEQWYEQGDIVAFTDNTEFVVNICEYCSDSLFDYSTEKSMRAKSVKYLDDINIGRLTVKYGVAIMGIWSAFIISYDLAPIISELLIDMAQTGDVITLIFLGWMFIFFTHIVRNF